MNYVYVLRNKKSKKLYIGFTKNLKQRLSRHGATKDIVLMYYEAYQYERDARKRESKLKMYGSAWRGLKNRLKTSFENSIEGGV